MLFPKDTMDPVANASNASRIPMVDLPLNESELKTLLTKIDAVLLTHMHRDHWDVTAQRLIDKNIFIFCPPINAEEIKSQGFSKVLPVESQVSFKGITISRSRGHHGTGEIEKKMGEVSGFILKDGRETVYIAGDTIWCAEVEEALIKHRPSITILNTGSAQFLSGDPITMTAEDVIKVYRTLPSTKVVAVHMETINHCLLTRLQLKAALQKAGLAGKVIIPADGEILQ